MSFNSSPLKLFHKGNPDPVLIYEHKSIRFTLFEAPLDNEVVFEFEVSPPDTIKLDYAIMVREPKEITGMEPRLGSKGVRRVAKSDDKT